MIIHLNGWPGVGKLTVARLLANRIGGRVLDNHSIYNVAFALTHFQTPEFYETVRGVRAVAYARVAKIDPAVPVILTDALTGGPWGEETRQAIQELAVNRGSKLVSIRLDCSPEVNARRGQSEERSYLGKLTDQSAIRAMREEIKLIDCAVPFLRVDTTFLSAEAVADRINAEVCDLRHFSRAVSHAFRAARDRRSK